MEKRQVLIQNIFLLDKQNINITTLTTWNLTLQRWFYSQEMFSNFHFSLTFSMSRARISIRKDYSWIVRRTIEETFSPLFSCAILMNFSNRKCFNCFKTKHWNCLKHKVHHIIYMLSWSLSKIITKVSAPWGSSFNLRTIWCKQYRWSSTWWNIKQTSLLIIFSSLIDTRWNRHGPFVRHQLEGCFHGFAIKYRIAKFQFQ